MLADGSVVDRDDMHRFDIISPFETINVMATDPKAWTVDLSLLYSPQVQHISAVSEVKTTIYANDNVNPTNK